MRRFLKNNKAFTLIESLVGLALISLSIGTTFATITTALNLKSKKQASEVVLGIRNSMISSINTTQGWLQTIDSNAAPYVASPTGGTNCLRAASMTGCTGSGDQLLIEFRNGGLRLAGYDINNMGFDQEGQLCNYLTSVNCVYRFRVRWVPNCDNALCRFPLIRIIGELDVKPSHSEKIPNPDFFSFEFVRGVVQNNSKEQCDAIGGVFNAALSTCTMAGSNTNCPQGQIVVGISSTGLITCGPYVNNQSCPLGQYPKGVSASGVFECLPLGASCTNNYPSGYSDALPGFGTNSDGDCGGDAGDCQ